MKPSDRIPLPCAARRPWALALAALLAATLAATGPSFGADEAAPGALPTAVVTSVAGGETAPYEGLVEAVRQTVLAAQVAGSVVALDVKAGDRVRAGQVLLRLDARAAEQTAAAGEAQVQAARAAQEAATREFERQKRLFQQKYISQAALDRAEAEYKTAQAQAGAQLAQAGAARTQSGFYVVKAPYDGVVADVAVVLGDMAMPGRPLVTVYDPRALRVKAAIPQTIAARVRQDAAPQAEVPGVGSGRIAPAQVQWLPTVDPATHTLELRLDLPAGLKNITPGMHARAWLPLAGDEGARLWVPRRAVVQRAELKGVYVIGTQGRPVLRQVRLGRTEGERVEVLSGVSAGEVVVLDPHAAARAR